MREAAIKSRGVAALLSAGRVVLVDEVSGILYRCHKMVLLMRLILGVSRRVGERESWQGTGWNAYAPYIALCSHALRTTCFEEALPNGGRAAQCH